MKEKYILAYMDMAERFAQTSEAQRLKVGAILVKNDAPIAIGINGTRSGFPTNVCEDDNNVTLPEVRHAEIACLDKLRKINESSVGAILFVNYAPCYHCSIEIVDAEISIVYYRYAYRCEKGLNYLREKGIIVEQIL